MKLAKPQPSLECGKSEKQPDLSWKEFLRKCTFYGQQNWRDRVRSEPCCWCGKVDGRRTIEHIVPLSMGGAAGYDNYVGACYTCNMARATQPILGYLMKTGGIRH
jgi:5-methylcytosine-specific restriction endonuclease McrA